MNRYLFTLLFVLFSSFLFSQNTFYVAPSSSGGSDSNNGSIGSPFETIQYGVNQLSSGGDKLIIRAGTYRETITINKIANVKITPIRVLRLKKNGISKVNHYWHIFPYDSQCFQIVNKML